jgi:hypothetical protein
MSDGQRTASELEFINQKTRELMVGWCDSQIKGSGPDSSLMSESSPVGPNKTYVEFAKSKGWISKDGSRILSAGWDTASRFLKR